MRIAIMGSGGVGGYFGARLAKAGHEVHFIARGAHLEAIRAHGLKVESKLGDVHLDTPRVTDRPSDVGTVDVAIVCVKLWDTEAAVEAVRPLLGPDSAVVSVQNSVKKDDLLRDKLGSAAVFGGVCYIATSIASPGVIRHVGTMQRLVFGEYDGRRSERTERLLAACREAGIDAEIPSDIERAIWEKFVFLVGMSSTTASIRLPIGPIRAHPRTRALLLDAMREAVAVGRAQGIALDEQFAENRLGFIDGLPADMNSSMNHDLRNGNRLELDWLGGDVVARGARLGVPTPVNRALYDVLALYAHGRPEGS
jgi:2-dehydropantoate 2-reductase